MSSAAALHNAALNSKPCLKKIWLCPAGVEMAVAVALTEVAEWTAIESSLTHTANVYTEEYLISFVLLPYVLGYTAQVSWTCH